MQEQREQLRNLRHAAIFCKEGNSASNARHCPGPLIRPAPLTQQSERVARLGPSVSVLLCTIIASAPVSA